MKTKLLSLCMALVCATHLFAYNCIVDGIYYNLNKTNKTAEVTYEYANYGAGVLIPHSDYSGVVIIPSSITYNSQTYSVTAIGKFAFSDCSGLTSVTIPNSVTTIGNSAFDGCLDLTSIDIPNSVTTIGDNAFYSCSGLTSVTIPNSVTTIGENTFFYCRGLTSVTIGNSVTTIGKSAFAWCSDLTSVTIPNSVTTIGEWAFRCVNNIIYNGTAIGSPWGANCVNGYVDGYLVYSDATKTTLCGCSSAATGAIAIPNSVTTIGTFAFGLCSSLTSITIPNSVTTIGDEAFDGCSGLTSIEIPNSVTTIGNYAFYGCSGLTSVTIGNSVTTIGKSAFYSCSGLTSVTIGNSVTTIEDYAFDGCSSLTSVTIPNSVTTIGYMAFSDCRGLTSVTIPNSVTTIGDYAFSSCYGLKSVTLNSNAITSKTYTSDNNLENIFGTQVTEYIIGNSITSIGDYAFYRCSGLTKTNYTGTIADWCKIKFGNLYSNPMYYSHNFYINDVEVKDLVIPNGVDKIGDYAFSGCTGLTSVMIPNSVTTIRDYAFYKCSGLTSVTIGNSVTTIEDAAFGNCSGLKSVTIPNSVTTIGSSAFDGCRGLKKTNYTGTLADWCKIKFGGSYSNPMYYSHNFYINDVEVKDLVIPEGVDTIGDYAFYDCDSLTSVTIPNSVTTIGEKAFYDCSGLKSITCEAINPPTCGYNCFYYVSKSIPVYVYPKSVQAYRQANGWKEFTNLQENPNDYAMITCIAENGTSVGGNTYIKGDTCILEIIPNAGYQFTQWTDGNIDNPRSFIVAQDSVFTAEFTITHSGQCGDDLYWKIIGDTLIITGSGAMYDYNGTTPADWSFLFKDKIAQLILPDGITHIGDSAFAGCEKIKQDLIMPNSLQTIGDYAFQNCKNITSISFGAGLESIGDYAFAGCIRIDNMTCPTDRTPDVAEHTFDMVSRYAYLYVLQPCERTFKIDPYWSVFDIQTIGAEAAKTNTDQVMVSPSATTAEFTWPADDQAAGYSIEITKDSVVFCTLKFNAIGQLTGIAFAPGRGHTAMAHSANPTGAGWQFTVTGLNQASKYAYTLDALNASQQSIKHYQGEFATDGYTDLLPLPFEGKDGIGSVKFIHNGRLLIERNGIRYDAHGARIE